MRPYVDDISERHGESGFVGTRNSINDDHDGLIVEPAGIQHVIR